MTGTDNVDHELLVLVRMEALLERQEQRARNMRGTPSPRLMRAIREHVAVVDEMRSFRQRWRGKARNWRHEDELAELGTRALRLEERFTLEMHLHDTRRRDRRRGEGKSNSSTL